MLIHLNIFQLTSNCLDVQNSYRYNRHVKSNVIHVSYYFSYCYVYGWRGKTIKRAGKTFKAILSILHVSIIIITFNSWAFAQEADIPGSVKGLSNKQGSDESIVKAKKEKPEQTAQILSWETGNGKSYLIPAMEIPAFLLLLNVVNRQVYHPKAVDYDVDLTTFWKNGNHGHWVIDHDAFAINQLAHPYQGAMHYGLARSAGINYWESLFYANVGSFLWEMGGETTNPSINDQIATGTGGSFLGEALFRMASLVLEGDGDKPQLWQELGAAVLSPSTGVNRVAFGDWFKPVFPSHKPATSWHLQLGANLNSGMNGQSGLNTISRYEAMANFSMAYGLPGKPEYGYKRPFDYFNFEITGIGNSHNTLDSVMIRGLLLGKKYDAGTNYRGIWGLYGGYDYISPHIIPVSSTSVSLGTTFQWWLSQAIALQSSVLGGVGYAAAGNVNQDGKNNYHYGLAPQGLLALRLIFGNRAILDFTGRAYYLTSTGDNDQGRTEAISRLNPGFTVRIYGRHALGLQYISSIRDAHYPDRAESHQKAGTVSLVYTLLGNTSFGAVDWRGIDSR